MSNIVPPSSNEMIDIRIERADASILKPENKLKSVLYYSGRFFKRLYNTFLLIRHGELRKPISSIACPMHWINTFSTLFFTLKISSCPAMMRAIIRHPRSDPENGVFHDRENAKVFVPLLKDLFPNENVTADDFLLTCHHKFINQYRQPILRFIGPQNIKKHGVELEHIVKNIRDHLETERQKGPVNGTALAHIFTTYVISRLLLGHPGPFEVYHQISDAIDFVNKYVMKKTWHQPIKKEEKKRYKECLHILREAVDTAFTTQEKPCLGSLVDVLREDKEMSAVQIKSTLLLMYFGGAETTASLLNYLLWQLGQHTKYQEEIFQEIQEKKKEQSLFELAHSLQSVEKLFLESIRLFTPSYVIGRQPAADLMCTVQDKNGNLLFREKISKKDGVLCGPTFAARDPSIYPEPDKFNPHRFESIPRIIPWLPFGDGKHACPGQWIAKAEVMALVTQLVQEYYIVSEPEIEIPQKGFMTLKQEGNTWLTLTKRA